MCLDKRKKYLSKIISNINKTNCFSSEVKSFHVFVGLEAYKDSNRESEPLQLENVDISYYQKITNGKVAFIPLTPSYPSSFLFMMNMIFDSIDIIKEIYLNENDDDINLKLVQYLYNKGNLFINLSDISDGAIDDLVNISKDVIFCGKDQNDTKDRIKEKLDGKQIAYVELCHPSGLNIDRPMFNRQWMEHKCDEKFDLKVLILNP